MKGVGRDGTRLFGEIEWILLKLDHKHAWVNAEGLLRTCFVGFLVPEEEDE